MQSAIVELAANGGPGGAIVFDPVALPQVASSLFEPGHWGVDGNREVGGRGAVWFLDTEFGPAVLRHYRRGGAVARVNRDHYLWLGAEKTRSFAEFRLLQVLRERGLPVPRPLAARYLHSNPMWYRADLLMQRIPDARSLAHVFAELDDRDAALQQLGATLARFHAAGVSHADLNAHNILLDRSGQWWLIDFDRGALRAPGGDWSRQRLQRLARSLRKLGLLAEERGQRAWQAVLRVHAEAMAAS